MRKMVPLNFGWRFSDHADASCRERDFNCQSWELVDIPHANKELPLHYFVKQNFPGVKYPGCLFFVFYICFHGDGLRIMI